MSLRLLKTGDLLEDQVGLHLGKLFKCLVSSDSPNRMVVEGANSYEPTLSQELDEFTGLQLGGVHRLSIRAVVGEDPLHHFLIIRADHV